MNTSSELPPSGSLALNEAGTAQVESAAVFRGKRFRYAVWASLASKSATAMLQIIALPAAAIALGHHDFALYALMSAMIGWLTLANLGVGPALVGTIAAARAKGDYALEKSVVTSATFPNLAVSALVSLVSLAGVWGFPISDIFGSSYASDTGDIRRGMTTLIFFYFAQSNISLFESAQAAHQEQHRSNLAVMVGSVASIVTVLACARFSPGPVTLIVALNGPILLARFLNAAGLVARHPSLRPSPRFFRQRLSESMLKSGVAFSLASGLGNFLSHAFPVILIGRAVAPTETASFAVTMSAIILASGVVTMLGGPLWGAMADSVSRNDLAWARKAYIGLLRTVMIFSGVVGTCFALFGEWIFAVWYQGKIVPDQNVLAAAGLYLILLSWESFHVAVLIGLRKVEIASILMCSRAVAATIAMVLLIDFDNGAMPFLVMSASILAISAVSLRRAVIKALCHG